jgi:adenine-specific DNA-methyltransferase
MIRAFRDTWELGIHSYLNYLRDRLLLVRELLDDTYTPVPVRPRAAA